MVGRDKEDMKDRDKYRAAETVGWRVGEMGKRVVER